MKIFSVKNFIILGTVTTLLLFMMPLQSDGETIFKKSKTVYAPVKTAQNRMLVPAQRYPQIELRSHETTPVMPKLTLGRGRSYEVMKSSSGLSSRTGMGSGSGSAVTLGSGNSARYGRTGSARGKYTTGSVTEAGSVAVPQMAVSGRGFMAAASARKENMPFAEENAERTTRRMAGEWGGGAEHPGGPVPAGDAALPMTLMAMAWMGVKMILSKKRG